MDATPFPLLTPSTPKFTKTPRSARLASYLSKGFAAAAEQLHVSPHSTSQAPPKNKGLLKHLAGLLYKKPSEKVSTEAVDDTEAYTQYCLSRKVPMRVPQPSVAEVEEQGVKVRDFAVPVMREAGSKAHLGIQEAAPAVPQPAIGNCVRDAAVGEATTTYDANTAVVQIGGSQVVAHELTGKSNNFHEDTERAQPQQPQNQESHTTPVRRSHQGAPGATTPGPSTPTTSSTSSSPTSTTPPSSQTSAPPSPAPTNPSIPSIEAAINAKKARLEKKQEIKLAKTRAKLEKQHHEKEACIQQQEQEKDDLKQQHAHEKAFLEQQHATALTTKDNSHASQLSKYDEGLYKLNLFLSRNRKLCTEYLDLYTATREERDTAIADLQEQKTELSQFITMTGDKRLQYSHSKIQQLTDMIFKEWKKILELKGENKELKAFKTKHSPSAVERELLELREFLGVVLSQPSKAVHKVAYERMGDAEKRRNTVWEVLIFTQRALVKETKRGNEAISKVSELETVVDQQNSDIVKLENEVEDLEEQLENGNDEELDKKTVKIEEQEIIISDQEDEIQRLEARLEGCRCGSIANEEDKVEGETDDDKESGWSECTTPDEEPGFWVECDEVDGERSTGGVFNEEFESSTSKPEASSRETKPFNFGEPASNGEERADGEERAAGSGFSFNLKPPTSKGEDTSDSGDKPEEKPEGFGFNIDFGASPAPPSPSINIEDFCANFGKPAPQPTTNTQNRPTEDSKPSTSESNAPPALEPNKTTNANDSKEHNKPRRHQRHNNQTTFNNRALRPEHATKATDFSFDINSEAATLHQRITALENERDNLLTKTANQESEIHRLHHLPEIADLDSLAKENATQHAMLQDQLDFIGDLQDDIDKYTSIPGHEIIAENAGLRRNVRDLTGTLKHVQSGLDAAVTDYQKEQTRLVSENLGLRKALKVSRGKEVEGWEDYARILDERKEERRVVEGLRAEVATLREEKAGVVREDHGGDDGEKSQLHVRGGGWQFADGSPVRTLYSDEDVSRDDGSGNVGFSDNNPAPCGSKPDIMSTAQETPAITKSALTALVIDLANRLEQLNFTLWSHGLPGLDAKKDRPLLNRVLAVQNGTPFVFGAADAGNSSTGPAIAISGNGVGQEHRRDRTYTNDSLLDTDVPIMVRQSPQTSSAPTSVTSSASDVEIARAAHKAELLQALGVKPSESVEEEKKGL